MKRTIRIALLVAMALLLVACGGTSGSAIGQSQSCRSSRDSGECTGKMRAVRGQYSYSVETDDETLEGTPVFVTAEVSVEAGALRVFLGNAETPSVAEVARPGQPARVHGPAVIDAFGDIKVGMHVVEGGSDSETPEVTGVTFAISWEWQ